MIIFTNNSTKIRETEIDGEPYLEVDSVAIVGDSEMNGLKYPDSVVRANIDDLVDMPVTMRHPKAGGKSVKAGTPRSISKNPTIGFVKSIVANGKDYVATMAINLSIAEKFQEVGQTVANLRDGVKHGVSTGLIPNVVNNAVTAIKWDHLALLSEHEKPAGNSTYTVNSSGKLDLSKFEDMASVSGLTVNEVAVMFGHAEVEPTVNAEQEDSFKLLKGSE